MPAKSTRKKKTRTVRKAVKSVKNDTKVATASPVKAADDTKQKLRLLVLLKQPMIQKQQ